MGPRIHKSHFPVWACERSDFRELCSELFEELLLNDPDNCADDAFGKLAEDEAMTLHALMMCSDPSYVLMEPGTLDMIREIRIFRQKTGTPIYFTLDAGPNIHLLYPDYVSTEAEDFVNEKLLPYTANGRVIKDKVGYGPQKLV